MGEISFLFSYGKESENDLEKEPIVVPIIALMVLFFDFCEKKNSHVFSFIKAF